MASRRAYSVQATSDVASDRPVPGLRAGAAAICLGVLLAAPGQAQECPPLVRWDGERQFLRTPDCVARQLARPEGQTWISNRKSAAYPYRFDADPGVPKEAIVGRALAFCKLLGSHGAGFRIRKRDARQTRVLFTCTPGDE